ncbi:ferritin-like domain-containing protein [Chitinimonas sp. JJ19]|uniref:ferritin-like domain-containing protein n=1 Tax=Chitinimonas sp. JJ19 TaxID=3109352 RepID=UPI001A544B77|nr:ferritin-like domain-containing protein [Chitinimonas sp.]
MSTLEQVCRKLATRLPANHVATQAPSLATLWPADFFRLPATAFWQQATAAQHDQLLHHCAGALLREALGIERTAMDYCARRVLATEDALEKQVYSLTGADEARHYHWLCSIADPASIAAEPDSFTRFLQRLVAEGSPQVQSYLLQIILEGWGIHHYQRLARHANDAAVSAVMNGIAQDEALHYAAGVAHFDAARLDEAERGFIRAALAELCAMLACGPLSVLGVVETVAGGFDEATRLRTLVALADPAQTEEKLQQLARYIRHNGMEAEADWLAAEGLLSPMPAEMGLCYYG